MPTARRRPRWPRSPRAASRPSRGRGPDHAAYDQLADHRVGEIGDVVEAILYLDRAGFVTGETLHVDGGQAAGH